MGSIVYMPKAVSVASSEVNSLLVDTVRDSQYTQTILDKMLENGKVTDELGAGGFDLGEIIANGIVEGFRRSLDWIGKACIEGLKVLWELLVDVSFYGCLFTATGAILMAYCGSKKSKKTIVVSIVLYVLIQMINAILIEQGFITP